MCLKLYSGALDLSNEDKLAIEKFLNETKKDIEK